LLNIIPACASKYISDDLKQAIIKSIQSDSSYRQVPSVMGVSLGSVSSITKVFISLFHVYLLSNIYDAIWKQYFVILTWLQGV